MCLKIRNNEISNKLYIAKEDIICYKILTEHLISPYRGYKYKFNKLVKAKLKLPSIIDGIYQFKLIKSVSKTYIISYIGRGLHSYSTINQAKEQTSSWFTGIPRYEIYKCIIPKNSEFYYDNVKKEYTSNQLIVKKVVK